MDEILRASLALKDESREAWRWPERPLVALGVAARIAAAVEDLEAAAVAAARSEGATWQQIADQLGVTRQVAHRKHARRLARPKEK